MFEVTVENVGRTAVTIQCPILDYYPTRWRPAPWITKWFIPVRRTIGVNPVKFVGMKTKNRVRLEPFDDVVFLLPVEPLALRLRSGSKQWVRAAVRVAGRRDFALSPRRTGLALGGSRWGLFPDRPSMETVVLRAVVHLRPDLTHLANDCSHQIFQ